MADTAAVAYASVQEPARTRRFTPRVVLAIVVICGFVSVVVGAIALHPSDDTATTLTGAAPGVISYIQQTPGLRLTLHAKRPSMQLNSQQTATVFVLPRADGKFDSVLTQPGPNITETYLLVDDRAYYATSQAGVVLSVDCLSPDQLPPLDKLQMSLNEAKIVDLVETDSPSVAPTDCPGGTWIQLTFAGEVFAVCKSPNNQLTHAISQDLDVTIEYVTDSAQLPSLKIPQPRQEKLLVCPSISRATTLPTLPTHLEATTKSSLLPRVARFGSASCGCKGKQKPCLFVHGVGMPFAGPMSNLDVFNWGNVHNHAPCCSSTKFVHYETWKHGWEEPNLQAKFCEDALAVSNSETKTVGDLILVTYSMGNLVAGGAVANGFCNLSNKVSWVSLAAPMQGSKTANLLEQKCNAGGWNLPLQGLLQLITLCPMTNAFRQLKHISAVANDERRQFEAASAVRKQYATNVLCGSSSLGLVSMYGPPLALVSALTHHGDVNDGVVAFESCADGFAKASFSTDYADGGNYLVSTNHLDNSFRIGDGWWGTNRKPLKWFECAL
ncbi:hypothetical protein ACHHYP_14705 [Achlya hypogyna]|uniref:Uncharacterized protein n=1 Tax=Achlya hypogyna TaxID=1202772 RepID=A0A1V9YCJ3_ACHHY|nr:hypothetical protein ACHHYP_14705 [Achlya hypogyna]